MPIDIQDLCLQVIVTPREICVRFPVGNIQCVSLPSVSIPDPTELIQQMFAQINAALSPLSDIFILVDAVIAVFECVKAIPKAITELDPIELIECLPGLAEAVNQLLGLIPQLSVPIMMVDILDVIILFLESLKNQLTVFVARVEAALNTGLKAASPGNFALSLVASCINANFDADIENLNEQLAPLNRLMGILDFMLEISGLKALLQQIGLDVMPCLGDIDLSGGLALALIPIDFLIKLLKLLRSIIPLPGSFGFSTTSKFKC